MIASLLVLYLIAQMAIGYWVSKRVSTSTDFYLAGKNLGVVLATFSLFATWFGAETCMGSAGAIFSSGLSGARADPFGYTLCLLLMGLLLAVPLWKRNIITLPDLFRQSFSRKVERVAVFAMIPATLLWSAAQVRAFGQILSHVTEVDVEWALYAATAFIIFYTFLGGLLADVMTDFLQGVVLVIGLVVLAYFSLENVGGFTKAMNAIEPSRLSFVSPGESWAARADAWLIPVLGSLVTQELISRVLASKSGLTARRASFTAGALYLSVGLIPVFLGLIGPQLMAGQEFHQDYFLIKAAESMLPQLGYVIFIGALVSAILSTVDSTLLCASSFFTQNVFREQLRDKSERFRLYAARGFVVFSGLVALFFAVSTESIYDIVMQASAFGSAGILTITFASLWMPAKKSFFFNEKVGVATLVVGIVANPFAEKILELAAPYLFSVVACIATYLAGCSLAFIHQKRRALPLA